jgi:GntR family transcriptional regulator
MTVSALITRTRSTPLHEQIRRVIDGQIASGQLAPGTRLPTEHDYATQFGVSLAPVRQALLALAGAGRVVRVKGRGTFVRAAKVEESISLLSSFTDNLRARGIPFHIELLDQARVRADAPIARALEIRLNGPVIRIRRLALIRDEPGAILDAYLDAERFKGLQSIDGFGDGRSLYGTLSTDFDTRLGRADNTLEVVRLDDERADLLQVPPGSPALEMQSITQDTKGRPVEIAWVTYRADRFTFTLSALGAVGPQ